MSNSDARRHHHDHTTDSWAERAKRYDDIIDLLEPELQYATEAMLDAVQVGSGTRLLDLACGPGHSTAAANARGAEALGIDSSPRMLEAARRRFPDIQFKIADMTNPPPGPWDAVICRLGAHHADDTWVNAAWRILVPGGRIALAEFDAIDETSRTKGMRHPSEWVRLLEGAGFVDVTVTTCILRLGSPAASTPNLVSTLRENQNTHLQDGLVYILAGRKPTTRT
ncbi:class I SAM-dependent methyltransferase [Nitrososphaera viennensis]|uniref:Methyltransferase domain-containing protein n=2 Tax=Nitrososphaera viennensis TaxID=1034015 RepID=A0A060HJ19_9ARCH|nr:class I SAM-dependent methyltransferase [Nitrososphaera viennensis]AIC15518.1 hypothetical protein NVIE_012820 [Nitrososphaera viennensis EN76]UVS70404.1 class I SAM-dependent methyltransferase [Nitrososphaera viennensis]